MHMSRGDLRAALQKLVSRGMLEVVDVPRKRREAAEIAEATGLFGKRGEAQDADANGMTKKKTRAAEDSSRAAAGVGCGAAGYRGRGA